MFVHNFTAHPGGVRLVQSEPDLLITGPDHSGKLGIYRSQPFFRYSVYLAKCLHLATLAFLLGLGFLGGWIDLCVWAKSMLLGPPLLPWLSWRHHAREVFRDRSRNLCWYSDVAVAKPLCSRGSRQNAELTSNFPCVRTQISGVRALA